ncbi:hypothetical protein FS749_011863 [Ceratobasidium sp. UAMH 11750]|nr:hypothetical protein FS749_011863 [Ceratobasidium sp. UAMH 11750]
MYFSRYLLALAPILATSVSAAPWKVVIDDEVAISGAEWHVTWVATIPVNDYLCSGSFPFNLSIVASWLTTTLAHTGVVDGQIWRTLDQPTVRKTLTLAVADYLGGFYKNPLEGGDLINWDNPFCHGKGKKLYKYDVPPPEKGKKRSSYRLVFRFDSIDKYDQVAVVNFCGVVAHTKPDNFFKKCHKRP